MDGCDATGRNCVLHETRGGDRHTLISISVQDRIHRPVNILGSHLQNSIMVLWVKEIR